MDWAIFVLVRSSLWRFGARLPAGSVPRVQGSFGNQRVLPRPPVSCLSAYDGQLAGHAEIARFALWLAMPRAGTGSGSLRDGCHRDDSTLDGKTRRARVSASCRRRDRGPWPLR